MAMEWIVISALIVGAVAWVANNPTRLRRRAIERARTATEDLVARGAIFEITRTSSVRGYHVRELGWVSCKRHKQSAAEPQLRGWAAEKFKKANVLTKLNYTLRDGTYRAGTGPKGNPYYRTRKVTTWEAMAGEAIPERQVDTSPIRWNDRMAVVDGSNVAHWGGAGAPELLNAIADVVDCLNVEHWGNEEGEDSASLDTVKAILHLLKQEGVTPVVVFDASIGHKVAGRHTDKAALAAALSDAVDVEIVPSGTVADRRIVELAEQRKAIIVSNDLFRDSRRARPVPKRRGFFLPQYDHAELLPPRA